MKETQFQITNEHGVPPNEVLAQMEDPHFRMKVLTEVVRLRSFGQTFDVNDIGLLMQIDREIWAKAKATALNPEGQARAYITLSLEGNTLQNFAEQKVSLVAEATDKMTESVFRKQVLIEVVKSRFPDKVSDFDNQTFLAWVDRQIWAQVQAADSTPAGQARAYSAICLEGDTLARLIDTKKDWVDVLPGGQEAERII